MFYHFLSILIIIVAVGGSVYLEQYSCVKFYFIR